MSEFFDAINKEKVNENLLKSFQIDLEKAKYTRREGTPGNYRYFYGDEKQTTKKPEVSKIREDRSGNYIGDGSFHHDYTVEDFPEYPSITSKVSKADTTETVYVKYRNKENGNEVTVRFSNHENNAVKFGDQLNGATTSRDEILAHLGLKKRVFVPDTMLSINSRKIAKKDMHNYEEAPLTIKEMYALGEGADLSKYKGKLAKDSNYLIQGDTITKNEIVRFNNFGQKVRVGKYVYE